MAVVLSALTLMKKLEMASSQPYLDNTAFQWPSHCPWDSNDACDKGFFRVKRGLDEGN